MKGIQHVEVSNKKVKFKFDLHRNITVVNGDSGTGKTTLFNMIADHTRLQNASGVNLRSTKPCAALTDIDWKNQLKNISDSIVFVDEGAKYVFSADFARAVGESSNYYVIFNREALYVLPYSVDEIYEIKTSGKYHTLKRKYAAKKLHRYTSVVGAARNSFQVLLTEDTRSGYQFFCNYFENTLVRCESAQSNSGIFRWLGEHQQEKVLVVADGAAFGAEMDRVMKLCQVHPNTFQLCLPESFEWLILKSGLIRAVKLEEILNDPSEYIESEKYFSWENFFEAFLVQNTIDTPFHYQKGQLNPVYTQESNSKRIAKEIIEDIKK